MHSKDHAIVMGASLAGLLAARVLSDHFKRVTLIERDELPSGPTPRRGVPQGVHCHGLLASGRRILDDLFPGFTAEAIAQGAIPGDPVRDCRWFLSGACLARPASKLNALLASRPLLEDLVRQRVLALANVTLQQNSQVERLTATPDRRRITGVVCAGAPLASDLVIDATGRGSRTPLWLTGLGYDAPAEETMDVGLRYTTRSFRRHPADLNGDIATVIPPTPAGKRGGVMLAQEGDRWTVTLMGHFEQHAPEDLPGFLGYARSLPAPFIFDTIRDAEPLGEAHSTRFPSSRRRHYERLESFPEGILVMGDAVCSFNPVYGQGMSVAALAAETLDSALWIRAPHLARRFFERLARIVDTPWSIAAGNDLRIPDVNGPRNPFTHAINWYMERLHRAAHHDEQLALAFHQVGNLVAPPAGLLHPRQAFRVLRGNLRAARYRDTGNMSATAIARAPAASTSPSGIPR